MPRKKKINKWVTKITPSQPYRCIRAKKEEEEENKKKKRKKERKK